MVQLLGKAEQQMVFWRFGLEVKTVVFLGPSVHGVPILRVTGKRVIFGGFGA